MFWSIIYHSLQDDDSSSAVTPRTLIEALDIIAPVSESGTEWALLERSRPSRGEQHRSTMHSTAASIALDAARVATADFLREIKKRGQEGISVRDIGGTDDEGEAGDEDVVDKTSTEGNEEKLPAVSGED